MRSGLVTPINLIMSPIATASTSPGLPGTAGALSRPRLAGRRHAILYAAKRMYDGKRHILVGWIRDLAGNRDGGAEQWGGTMCVPASFRPDPRGSFIPVPFPRPSLSSGRRFLPWPTGPLSRRVGGLTKGRHSFPGRPIPAPLQFEVPDHYLLEAHLQLDPRAELTVVFRAQSEGTSAIGSSSVPVRKPPRSRAPASRTIVASASTAPGPSRSRRWCRAPSSSVSSTTPTRSVVAPTTSRRALSESRPPTDR